MPPLRRASPGCAAAGCVAGVISGWSARPSKALTCMALRAPGWPVRCTCHAFVQQTHLRIHVRSAPPSSAELHAEQHAGPGEWIDIEDCPERFNVKGGSGEKCVGCGIPCPRSRTRHSAAKPDGSYDVRCTFVLAHTTSPPGAGAIKRLVECHFATLAGGYHRRWVHRGGRGSRAG